jgi:hypothetical protein
MRPSAVGSSTPLASTQVFNPPFLASLNDFAALRTMDFSATNGNEIVHWSDRTRPGDASQAIGNPGVPAGGWEGPGGAWEYAILLANQTSKDLWINVPLNADNDYITKLAQLTKYGSDGTTPYTSTQTSPVWPGLNSNLHLYVEFSNEVWNTAGAFAGTENHTEAVAEVNAGGSPLNFDGDTNDWNWAWRRPAEKIVQISTIFRSVWKDAAMMTTVRPVLESQLGYADGPLLQEMHLMVDYYYNPVEVSSPQPPSYYIYGLGGSAYYNPTDKSSVDSIFSTMATGFVSDVQGDVDYALPFGVRRIAYEGGPSLDSTGNSSEDANQAAAWADPRMEQVIVIQQNAWSQANGDLLVYFDLAGDYQWAFMSDVLSPSSPKMSGIADILASPRSASTYGAPIPATLTASSANVPPAWLWSDGSNTKMHDYKWTGFSVLVSTQGVFTVSLTADSATSGAQAEILVDGNSIGTVTVPSSGNTSALSTPTLSVGSHGILVRSLSGTFNLTQVVVQTGTATLQPQTITFANPGPQTVGTPLTLVATASSDLTVSFTSTTTSTCTVSGATATFIASGTCTIDANQAGNSTYAQAPMVPQSFMVNSASATFYTLPAERMTTWQPGVTYNGGIPTNRTQCGATVTVSGDKTGVTDQANIQTAINNCTANHYVLLGPGTFYIQVPSGNNGGLYIEQSNITLRGSGAGTTVLDQVGSSATIFGIIIVGAEWYHWAQDSNCNGTSNCTDTAVGTVTAVDGIIPLSTDTVKESYTATVATSDLSVLSKPLAVGELVQITEQFDPNYIWYNPGQDNGQCGSAPGATKATGYCGWGEDGDDNSLGAQEMLVARPIGQTNQITAISTNGATTTITFAAPWHHAFRVSHAADIARPSGVQQMLTGIGIEDLTAANGGGGDGGGNIVFWAIANSWMKNIESYNAGGGAVHFDGCFRCELRDSYVHTAGSPNPGGGGYGMEIDTYTSDSLFENNISWSFNKVMVMRGDGGGNVIGYNYFEDGYGAGYYGCPSTGTNPQGGQPYTSTCDGIPEAGINATHMTGTQYALFEGNQSFNITEDDTWGNATYITFFRNHATTLRRNVNNGAGTDNFDGPNCSTFACFGPVVQLSDTMGRIGINVPKAQWWHSYVGNVLGIPNNYLQNPAIGYAYPATFSGIPGSTNSSEQWFFEWNGIYNGGASPGQDKSYYWTSTLWEIGDSGVSSPDAPSTINGAGGQTALNSVLRDGNFDYVTNKTHWMGTNNLCNAPGDAACTATNTGNICTDPLLCAGQYETAPAVSALPNSLYIPASMQPPPFFNGGAWPWIDGTNASNPIPGTLPARTRFDAGTPNIVPTSSGGGQSQTITFANPGTQTVGTPLTLTATASSTLIVSFTSTTISVCTVSGGIATFLTAGTCTIQATQAGNSTYAPATPVSQDITVNSASGAVDPTANGILPADRVPVSWASAGIPGGIPARTAIYLPAGNPYGGYSVDPTFANSGKDATSAIQTAIENATPNTTNPSLGQVVLLPPGTFNLTTHLYLKSGVSLRGVGNCVSTPSSCTTLAQTGDDNTVLFDNWGQSWNLANASNLAEDTLAGAVSIQVAQPANFTVGQTIAIAEEPDPAYVSDAAGQNLGFGDINFASTQPSSSNYSNAYTGAQNIGQVDLVTAINGSVLTLQDPLNWPFQTALSARAVPLAHKQVMYAGVEDLTMKDNTTTHSGYVWFNRASYSWLLNVETAMVGGIHITVDGGTHNVVENSIVHHAAGGYTQGGGAYGVSVQEYTSYSLIDNNILYYLNKPFVLRCDGGNNVVAYNYADDAQLGSDTSWQELDMDVHLAQPHMDLFEGNYAPHIGASNTWRSANNLTYYRNFSSSRHLTLATVQTVNVAAIEADSGMQNFNFLGNVLGSASVSGGTYEGSLFAGVGNSCNDTTMWRMGEVSNPCNYGDALAEDISEVMGSVSGTFIRHGNFDYVTGSTKWETTIQGGNASNHTLPASLYLAEKPSWWGTAPWPWVGPDLTPMVGALPAQARFAAFSPSIAGCQNTTGCVGP